jgi:hypothetical protein
MSRNSHLKRKYGINVAVYELMAEAQNNRCAICGRPPKKRRLHVDHNHKDGRVRGLLCFQCNYALGRFNNDILKLRNAIKYLNKTKKTDWRENEKNDNPDWRQNENNE